MQRRRQQQKHHQSNTRKYHFGFSLSGARSLHHLSQMLFVLLYVHVPLLSVFRVILSLFNCEIVCMCFLSSLSCTVARMLNFIHRTGGMIFLYSVINTSRFPFNSRYSLGIFVHVSARRNERFLLHFKCCPSVDSDNE